MTVVYKNRADQGGVWNPWNPAWTNLTVGNGTVDARYVEIGSVIHFKILFTLGSTSSVSGLIEFTPPTYVNLNGADTGASVSSTAMFRSENGSGMHIGAIRYSSPTNIQLLRTISSSNTWGGTSATQPFTWTTGDKLWAEGTYEAL